MSSSSSSSSDDSSQSQSVDYENDRYDDDTEEPSNDYDQGGYHPVSPGDVFNGRYFNLRKLGWGHFATVWLCFDTKRKAFRALKISKSRSDFVEAAKDELRLLTDICSGNPLHEGFSCVVQMYHDFEIIGVDESLHHCMVFEVLGDNLLTILRRYNPLSLNLVKVIAQHVLQGLSYLHDECQIIHTDIKPENVVICLTEGQLQHLVKEAYKAEAKARSMVANTPKSYRMKYILGIPIRARKVVRRTRQKHRVKFEQYLKTIDNESTKKQSSSDGFTRATNVLDEVFKDVNKFYEKLQDENPLVLKYCKFKIVDFGNSCHVDQQYTDEIQTQEYRSPESIFRDQYDTSADIWSTACLIFELITGEYLFCPEADREKGYNTDDDHIAKMIETLGPIPFNLFQNGSRYYDIMDEEGKVRRIRKLASQSLLDILMNYAPLTVEEVNDLTRFLKPMLEYDIHRRATAAECLHSNWLHLSPREKNLRDEENSF